MHGFKGNKNVISNETIRHGGILGLTNNVRKEAFQPICEDLGCKPRNDITKANGSILCNLGGVLYF